MAVAVTTSADNTACVWELPAGALRCRLAKHIDNVNTCCFTPDGQLIITASNDNTAIVWRSADGASIAVLEGHAGEHDCEAKSGC